MRANTAGKNVWMVVHEQAGDVGSYGLFLNQMGIQPSIFLATETDFAALDARTPDLLIVMGGPMGVYEAGIYPWMRAEIDFVERRIAADKPLLGVCLGSQMIAKALGANVYKGQQGKEIGWHPVTMNEAGLGTPLRHFDKSQTLVTQWHGDTFNLPQDAVLLGSNAKYENQAYSYGRNVMAVQFHPEMTADVFERWMLDTGNELPEVGLDPAFLRAGSKKYGPGLLKSNFNFFTRWLRQVAPTVVADLRTTPANDRGTPPSDTAEFARQYTLKM